VNIKFTLLRIPNKTRKIRRESPHARANLNPSVNFLRIMNMPTMRARGPRTKKVDISSYGLVTISYHGAITNRALRKNLNK
jgi:hypothetical protein